MKTWGDVYVQSAFVADTLRRNGPAFGVPTVVIRRAAELAKYLDAFSDAVSSGDLSSTDEAVKFLSEGEKP